MNDKYRRFLSRHILFTLVILALESPVLRAQSATVASPVASTSTKIVLLGTGHVLPNPDHQGPSLAIVVNGTPYIVDAGVGVVRQLMEQIASVFRRSASTICALPSSHTFIATIPWACRI